MYVCMCICEYVCVFICGVNILMYVCACASSICICVYECVWRVCMHMYVRRYVCM